MARKINTEKVKKKGKKKKILIVLLFIIIVAGLSAFLYFKLINKGPGTQTVVKVLSSLDEYNYTLTDQDSAYYKKEFEELKKILNADTVDQEAYAKQVAKMFAIDLYTMSTKMNKYDIGGYEFFYNDKVEMHSQKVMDTLYSQMADNTYGDRKQELPTVKSVEIISCEEFEYKLNDTKVSAYQIKLNISYEKDMGYDTEATIVVCKESGIRLSVVDFQPTLDPKYEESKTKE